MAQNYRWAIAILALSASGVAINVISIVILMLRKGSTQMFHQLLKLLALYDLVSCLLSFFTGAEENGRKEAY